MEWKVGVWPDDWTCAGEACGEGVVAEQYNRYSGRVGQMHEMSSIDKPK